MSTNLAGTLDLGNGGSGFELHAPFPAYPDAQATIGGATAAARNIIQPRSNGGAGGPGLLLASAGSNTVQGNFIGTMADGVTALGNHFNGILGNGSSKAVTIGGAGAGEGNVVAFNYPGAANGVAQGGIVVDNQFSTPTIAIQGEIQFTRTADPESIWAEMALRLTTLATATPGRTTCRISPSSPPRRLRAARPRLQARSTVPPTLSSRSISSSMQPVILRASAKDKHSSGAPR